MIERDHIDGRDATVAYLTADFKPATKLSADMAKIIYDDGDTQWVALREPPLKEEEADG